MDTLHAQVRHAVFAQWAAEEAEIRRMLGKWVSGLEPALLRDQRTGRLTGLTIEGVPIGEVAPVVVRSRFAEVLS